MLNTRELYLVLKARDEASRAIRAFGGNLGRLGKLQAQLDQATVASAAKASNQRKAIARAEVAVQQAKTNKLVELSKVETKANQVRAEWQKKIFEQQRVINAKSLEMAQATTRKRNELLDVRMEKEAAVARLSAALTDGDRERAIEEINIAKLKMQAIRNSNDIIILSIQERILASREIMEQLRVEQLREVSSAMTIVQAEREKADAAIRSAQERVGSEKEIQAAIARTSAAQKAAIGSSIAAAQSRGAAAQRTLAHGTSIITGGVVAGAIGAVGLAELNKTTNAYIEYNREVARTKTQVDQANISIKQLGAIGFKVGKELPVDFDKIQPTLYDIFSSIDVNAPQAARLLRIIGKEGVAGQTDMQVAGQATIGVLNAYKLSVSDASHVSDVLFELVKKGVGTYQQFASTIGRAVPSAVKAGQSFEDLAGIMAFLTRNGLSAAMAASSAGRALDALANPASILNFRTMGDIAKTTVKELSGPKALAQLEQQGVNFKKMGLNVLDASGNMRPVVDIIHDINKALDGLTREQKNAVLKEVFKGSGGTIQAMRFFNHALNDTNDQLGVLTGNMKNAAGATEKAFKTMKDTPAAKLQLLKNRIHELSIEFGQFLIPLKIKLLGFFEAVLKWFNDLPGPVKRAIALMAAFTASALVIAGILAVLYGLAVTLTAAVTILGANFLLVAGALAGFIAAGVGIALIIKYHKQLEPYIHRVWAAFLDVIKPLKQAWDNSEPTIVKGLQNIWDAVKGLIGNISDHGGEIKNVFAGIVQAVIALWKAFVFVWPTLSQMIATTIKIIGPLLDTLLAVLSKLSDAFHALPSGIQSSIIVIGLLALAFRGIIGIFLSMPLMMLKNTAAFSAMTTVMANKAALLKGALAGLVVGTIIGQQAGKIGGGAGLLTGFLGGGAGGALIGGAVGGAPGAVIGGVVGSISGLISAWHSEGDAAEAAAKQAQAAMEQEKQAIDAVKASVLQLLQSSKGALGNVISSASSQLAQAGAFRAFQKRGIGPQEVLAVGSGQITANKRFLAVEQQILEANPKLHDSFLAVREGVLQGEIAYEAAQHAMGKYVGTGKVLDNTLKNLKNVFDNTGTSLSKFTIEGLRNNAIIGEHVTALRQEAVAQTKTGKSVGAAINTYYKNLDVLAKNLKQLGFNKRAIDAQNRAYKDIPQSVITRLSANATAATNVLSYLQYRIDSLKQGNIPGIDVNTAAGQDMLSQLQGLINGIHGGTVDININTAQAAQALLDMSNAFAAGAHGPLAGLFGGLAATFGAAARLLFQRSINSSTAGASPGATIGGSIPGGGGDGSGSGSGGGGGSGSGSGSGPKNKPLTPVQKAWQRLKSSGIHTFISTLSGTAKSIKNAEFKFNQEVADAGGSKKLMHWLKTKEKLLNHDIKMRDKYAKDLKNAQNHLAKLKSDKSALQSSIFTGISSGFDITAAPPDITDIVGLSTLASGNATRLASDIKKLTAMGLDPDYIAQLAAQGASALPIMDALLGANKSQIRTINKNAANIQSVAKTTSKAIADQMYDPGIALAQAAVDGFKKKLAHFKHLMRQVADDFVKRIEQDLGNDKGKKGKGNKPGKPPKSNANTGHSGKTGLSDNRPNIVINTNEINPKKHAADLHWELSRRVP